MNAPLLSGVFFLEENASGPGARTQKPAPRGACPPAHSGAAGGGA